MKKLFHTEKPNVYTCMLAQGIHLLPKELFENRTFEYTNFLEIPLKGISFQNCTFIGADFRNLDLTETTFEGCIFKEVKLEGATLGPGIKFNDQLTHLELVQEYARLIDQKKIKEAEALNKILGSLKLNLQDKDLRSLDLTGINLRNAILAHTDLRKTNLTRANLQGTNLFRAKLHGVHLSETLTLNYQDLKELFPLWRDAWGENKLLYQKLINAHVNIFDDVPNEDLKAFFNHRDDTDVLDLSNADIAAQLQGCNLRRINFQNTHLSDSNLTKADLTEADLTCAIFNDAILEEAILTRANLHETDLQYAKLNKVWLSDTLQLPNKEQPFDLVELWINAHGEDKKLYKQLFHTRIQAFLTPSFFKHFIDNFNPTETIDLTNINLSNDCNNINKNAFNIYYLKSIDLKRMILRKSVLCGLDLSGLDFSRVNLEKADLSNSDLEHTNFSNSNLKNVNFEECRIFNTNFTNADFSDNTIDFENLINIKLGGTNLRGTQISQYIKRNDNLQIYNRLIPYYKDLNELFPLCMAAKTKEDKEFWQGLICTGINIFKGVPNKDLKTFFNQRKQEQILKLINTDFSECELQGVNFRGADLTGANFSKANLLEADLTDAILINTNFIGAHLVRANIKGSKISNTTTIPIEFDDQQLLQTYYTQNLDEETKNSLKSILIAKELLSEIQEPIAKRLKIE